MEKLFVLMYMDSDEQTYANKVFLGVETTLDNAENLRDSVLSIEELRGRFHDFNESNLEIEEIKTGEIYYNF